MSQRVEGGTLIVESEPGRTVFGSGGFGSTLGGSGGGAAAKTRVESAEPTANAAPPFNMSRREIPLRFIRLFPLVRCEVGYTKAYLLFRRRAFSLSSTARLRCS